MSESSARSAQYMTRVGFLPASQPAVCESVPSANPCNQFSIGRIRIEIRVPLWNLITRASSVLVPVSLGLVTESEDELKRRWRSRSGCMGSWVDSGAVDCFMVALTRVHNPESN